VLAIAGAAVVVRLIALALVPAARVPQVFEHEEIAHNVLSGVGFQWGHLGLDYLSMRPLFVYLCVVVYAVTGHSYLAMQIVQALIAAVTVLVTAVIAQRLAGPTTAVLAAAAIAIEPGLLYYDIVNVHPLGLQTLLFALLLLAVLHLMTRPSALAFALTGVALGAAVLERGTALFVMPFALMLVWRETRLPIARLARLTAVLVATAAAVHTPWLVRNWVVYGEPVFIMTAAPELLWIGNNPTSTGTAFAASGRPAFTDAPAALRARVFAERSEQAQMAVFNDEVQRFWRIETGAAAALYLKKLYFAWWFAPQSGTAYPGAAFQAYKFVYFVELVLAIVGTAALLRTSRHRHALMLVAFLVIVSVVQSMFFVEGRHRLATMPALLPFAAAGMLALAGRLRPATVPDESATALRGVRA
jgi:4-amino-4-deoxy-L-arabinose transferase-like glycosyltransferase